MVASVERKLTRPKIPIGATDRSFSAAKGHGVEHIVHEVLVVSLPGQIEADGPRNPDIVSVQQRVDGVMLISEPRRTSVMPDGGTTLLDGVSVEGKEETQRPPARLKVPGKGRE